MKRKTRNSLVARGKFCLALGAGIILAACGNGGGGGDDQTAGVGGTGIAVGKITDFGSIFVNGVEYETGGIPIIVDDDPSGTQDDLEIGMVVRLKVKTSNGELTTKATEVVYDDAVQGPVTGLAVFVPGVTQRNFSIFGQSITIDVTRTIFKGDISFTDIANDDIVEVSGFLNESGGVTATFVEDKGSLMVGSEVEVRGSIENYDVGPPQSFEINGFSVTVSPLAEIDVPGGMLNDGLFVEVNGTIVDDTTLAIQADKIEFEDDVFDDGLDEISLQGIISNYDDANSTFEIGGLTINFSGAQISPLGVQLANGLEVEAEGDLVGGVLHADEVELREGESKVEALVQDGSVNTSTGRFEVYYQNLGGTITVRTDNQTLFKDEISVGALPNFALGDLAGNNFVRVEGQEIAGELVASIVKRIDDPGDGNREFELRGAVDDFFPQQWIEILGIRFFTDDGTETEYEDGNEVGLTATQFFLQLGLMPNGGIGTLVEIEDDATTYGVADEVEFDD